MKIEDIKAATISDPILQAALDNITVSSDYREFPSETEVSDPIPRRSAREKKPPARLIEEM